MFRTNPVTRFSRELNGSLVCVVQRIAFKNAVSFISRSVIHTARYTVGQCVEFDVQSIAHRMIVSDGLSIFAEDDLIEPVTTLSTDASARATYVSP